MTTEARQGEVRLTGRQPLDEGGMQHHLPLARSTLQEVVLPVELLGTHAPISWSSLLVLLCGVLLGYPAGRWLATSMGWRRRASVTAWTGLSAVLALTVTPDGALSGDQGYCLPDHVAQLWSEPLRSSGGVGGGLLNILLFLPLGAALVVASGRVWIAVSTVLVLPAASFPRRRPSRGHRSRAEVDTRPVVQLLGLPDQYRRWHPGRGSGGMDAVPAFSDTVEAAVKTGWVTRW